MKKMFATLAFSVAALVCFAVPPVTEKVLKQFSAAFPTVENARWFESNDHYDVYFEKEGMKSHLLYDLNGKVLSTWNYYRGEKLSPFIKAKVEEKYPGKSIFGVTEVASSEDKYYVVVLEDATTWTNVRVDAIGQMTVLEKFRKAEK